MENTREKLYDEITAAKAEVVMRAIGKSLIEQEQEEFEALIQESQDFKVPKGTHDKAYEVIKDYEQRVKISKRKATLRRLGRACAIMFAVIGISGVVFINNAEAFKYHFKNFMVEINPEYITLFPNDQDQGEEQDMNMAGLWYPQYMPDGFQLIDKVESTFDVVFMFENAKGQTVKFCQGDASGVGLNLNNEGDAQGQIKIQEQYDGYWTSTRGNTALVWVQSDQLMILDADIEREEIFKIANSVAYQK